MYQADPSVIISGKLADKEKLFPSANIIMFLVLNEKALDDLKYNSDSLSHLHSQLSKETPVIICSEFSNYQEMEHAAEETKQHLLLPKKYDYLKANKFIANFYDINEEDLPAIVMVDAKKNGNINYLQRNQLTSINELLIAVKDIASHFTSSPSMTYHEFKNTQLKRYNFRSRDNPTNKEIDGIFDLFLQSLFDKSNKRLVHGLILKKLASPALKSSKKLLNVITSINDLFSKKTNRYSGTNSDFEFFNTNFPHNILDPRKSGLNAFSQRIVGTSYKCAQNLFNIDEDDDPITVYKSCASILRPIIETELHASHFAFLRREVGVDIARYYLTWDQEIGQIEHLNESLNGLKLKFPTNRLMYTQYQANTGEDQDIFFETLRSLNHNAVHQNYSGQFEEVALNVSVALGQDWRNLAKCVEKCIQVRQSQNLETIYNEYNFTNLTASTADNMQ
jgi:hypothetical protein